MQRVILLMPDGFAFVPGQYLEVLHPDGAIPLSIASAPSRLPELHLHYLSLADAPEAHRMDELLDGGNTLEIRGPAGDVRLPVPLPAPALIVAGGTGIAQAMSFLDAFGTGGPGAPVTLLWCADRPDDFYLQDDLRALEAPWLDYVLIADARRSALNRGIAWLRRHGGRFTNGPPASRAASRAASPSVSPIVLCGGPGFVHAAADALTAAGVRPDQMQSDVFSYAPRD